MWRRALAGDGQSANARRGDTHLAVVANVELVDEDIIAASLGREEAKALLAVEPLDDAGVLRLGSVVTHLAAFVGAHYVSKQCGAGAPRALLYICAERLN